MKENIQTTASKLKVEKLKKQIFEMKLEKSVSGTFNQAKANLLKKEIAKIVAGHSA
ncbi:MAG: hypothetical protein QE271_02625 [Bacteriovoracaceae bacterium]|nr:hypothetical protein [Bacteriovoracaceae bacterium]